MFKGEGEGVREFECENCRNIKVQSREAVYNKITILLRVHLHVISVVSDLKKLARHDVKKVEILPGMGKFWSTIV